MIKNELKILMGGEERTLRYSMISSKKLIEATQNGEFQKVISSSVDLAIYLIDLGLRDKPEEYSTDLLMEWIDEMSQEEYDKADSFAKQAMGFIIKREQDTAKQLREIMPEMEIPAEEVKKPQIKPSIN
jgi:hypothetical protein